ncbi:hypothetical protein BN948_01791 [Hydrogenophaga intermedia]|uniref:Uncharacterized protein n=1 Tax=Hydrogenophaga intermedia TaxID=65786 RepID=A0A1L1PHY2_HYDIT|nr:hypothetical protein [Hydrogenophaga intermedia]CDN87369.1 hypothetical protein BN948_01791 [Hydrogenophaga intermedia]
MSQRYGRNQKRRAREALATAQSEALQAKRLADSARQTIRSKERAIAALEAVVSGVRDALGRESILLDPIARRMHNYTLRSLQLAEELDVPLGPSDPDQELASLRIHTADVLEAVVTSDHWARQIHFELHVGEGRMDLRYAIDSRLLFERAARGRVVEHVTHYMAAAFERELAKLEKQR